MRRALFVCTSALHRDMYRSLCEAAAREGLVVEGLIDEQIPIEATAQVRRIATHPFSLRGMRRLARGERRARAEALLGDRLDVLIVGNDVAPLERAMVAAARARGVAVVLLQDGLFPVWTPRTVRIALARAARGVRLSELAPTEYGTGAATHIGALGSAWVEPLRRRSSAGRVTVTGNVALADVVMRARSRPVSSWREDLGIEATTMVVFFTSDLFRGLGRLQPRLHARQIEDVSDTAEAASRAGCGFAVRLHPNEQASDYPASLGRWILPTSTALAVVLGATDVGVFTLSSVALPLAQLGRGAFRVASRDLAGAEQRAAQWLGLPVVDDVEEAIRVRSAISSARTEELILDPARSLRATLALVVEAAGETRPPASSASARPLQ